jgi:uncharacterized protein
VEDRLRSGEAIVVRHVRNGSVFLAWSAVVVEDTGDLLAYWIPAGAECARPVVREELPYEQPLVLRPWAEPGVLQVVRAGVAHAIWHFPDSWYVNLQEPFRRTRFGIDTADQLLDLVRTPDGRFSWKDEDELEAAVAAGFLRPDEAAAVRAEAERVIASDPFPTGWEDWRPDPSWPVPSLPEGWDAEVRDSR